MANMNLFSWIFLLMMLQPVLRQKMLEWARIRQMIRLEKSRGTRVITLIHRQETMGFLGFPIFRYIDIDDSEAVLRAIKLTGEDIPIDLILHTPGGLVLAAEQIAHAIQRRKANVTVFVPHYAMSGGTLIALAADEIVIDENAVLGPVDPQLGEQAAASILKVLERKHIDRVTDRTVVLADMAEKATRQVKEVVNRLLAKRMESGQAQKTAEQLTSGAWTHDYPITVEQAQDLGLPIRTEVPDEVYRLMCLYPQTSQRRPSVEYVPIPREPSERQRKPESDSASKRR
jgi:ClpP class serine protease